MGRLAIARPSTRSFHATNSLRFRCTPPLFAPDATAARRIDESTTSGAPKPTAKRPIAYTAMAPDGAMFSHPAPEPGSDFNVVMIGAGVSSAR
jgi:hypothetical protein